MRLNSVASVFLTMILVLPNAQANSRKVAKPNSASSSVVAEVAPTKSIPELISYDELRSMNKIQREKYLTRLQNLLITISDSSSWETAGLGPSSKWQNWLEQLLETADAKVPAIYDFKQVTCTNGTVRVRDGRSWKCVAQKSCPMGTTLVQVSEDGLSCQTMAIGGNCPAGFLPQVDADTKTTYCLPSSALQDSPRANPDKYDGLSEKDRKELSDMLNGKGPKKDDGRSAEGEGVKKDDNPISPEDRKLLGEMLTNPEKTDPKYLPKPPQKAEGESTKPATKCWWEEMQKCETSSKKRKAIAKEWYKSKPKDGELSCIYAGNVSTYKNPAKPKPGECKPTSEATFGGKTFKCPEGQSLCSPLVFGVKDFEKGEGFCSKGNNATQDCAKKGDAAGAVGLIQNLGPSAAFEWDRLKEGLKKLVASCILEDKEKNTVSINSKAFQCQECQVIAARVAEMRSALNSKLSELSCELTATGKVAEVAGSASGSSDSVPAPKAKGTR